MNDGAVNVVCIYQFREGPGKHTPRPSYDILVGENWVPWQGHCSTGKEGNVTEFTFYEDYFLYEVTVEDPKGDEKIYVIAADNFNEAVAAADDFFCNRMKNSHLTITGVKELRSPVLTFAVGETTEPASTE